MSLVYMYGSKALREREGVICTGQSPSEQGNGRNKGDV